MSLFSPEASVRPNRSWGAAGALALAVVFGGFVAVALAASAKPSTTLAVAAGIALLAALSLALARYETAAGLSMLILGVVFVEPAPPDALLMVVIAVALVTGNLSLSRVRCQFSACSRASCSSISSRGFLRTTPLGRPFS